MKIFSRRVRDELGRLQTAVRRMAADRDAALRLFIASRNATTPDAQREFWLEFACLDQEYRFAVLRLAQFCTAHAARNDDNVKLQWTHT